ncbi:MAG: hypothetical protein GKR94_09615 [Gammaproteobacteria bacterium]|nr:hypothetical protein [Gammaproteobacteria bacterium]
MSNAEENYKIKKRRLERAKKWRSVINAASGVLSIIEKTVPSINKLESDYNSARNSLHKEFDRIRKVEEKMIAIIKDEKGAILESRELKYIRDELIENK